MNQNELIKHIRFQMLIYILFIICFLLSLFAILTTPVKAAGQLKSTNITQAVMNTTDCGSATNNSYCYCSTGVSSSICNRLSFGSTGGYTADTFNFDLHVNSWAGNAPSTIELYSPTNMWINTSYSCGFYGVNAPSSCSVSRVSSNRININFTTGSNTPIYYLWVSVSPYGYFSNLSINKVMLLQTVEDPNAALIENQQQNTTNIINNANANTEQITNSLSDMMNIQNLTSQDNINESRTQLEMLCNNSLHTELKKGYRITGNDNLVADNLSFYTPDYIPIPSGTTSVYIQNTNTEYIENYWLIAYNSNKQILNYWSTNSRSRTLPSGTAYIRFASTYPGILITTNGKCSTTEDAINSWLRDDSNPSINQSDIEGVISDVQINNPVSYLLTLPVNLVNKINQVFTSGTCSSVNLGHFGFAPDYDFVLPCINFQNYLGSTIWNLVDTIVAAGFIALTFYKIYKSVTNILSLGAEDEISYHLGYLTPMEFLAQIIGTGSWTGGRHNV